MLHDGVEDGTTEGIIAVPRTVSPCADVFAFSLHGVLVPRYEALGDGDEPPTSCLGFAVPDDYDAPPQLDVSLADVPVLADATAGVDEHENVAHFGHRADAAPELVPLADCERLLLVLRARPVDIEIPRIVACHEVVPRRVLVELFEQGAHFLLRRLAASTPAHVVDDHVEMGKADIDEDHAMKSRTMAVGIAVADTC